MAEIFGGAGPTALLVPHYIKARTADQLMRACFENNTQMQAFVNYYSIQFVSGYWYAWFYKDVSIGIESIAKGPGI